MSAEILNGKEYSKELNKATLEMSLNFQKEYGEKPKLAAILVGNDPASHVYVRNKKRACDKFGLDSDIIELPESVTTNELLEKIEYLNNDHKTHGILIQQPLPEHIELQKIVESVKPIKDR